MSSSVAARKKEGREPSLRSKLTSRICRHLGVDWTNLAPDVQALMRDEVDVLVHSAVITPSDLANVVRKLQLAIDRSKPAGAEQPPQQLPASAGPRPPVPPTEKPALAATARAQRPGALKHLERLDREAAWAETVAKETVAYQQAKAQEKQLLLHKKEEQAEVLAAQMAEHARLKREAEEKAREEAQRVVEKCQQEIADERREKEAAKLKIVQERERRDAQREASWRQRAEEKQRRIVEERRFLEALNAEESKKRDEEKARKMHSRAEFKGFLDENMVQERQKRAEAEQFREQERREIERRQQVLAEREAEARRELKRQDEKGQTFSKRQSRILEQYTSTRHQLEEEARMEEQRRLDAQQAREQRERHEEQEKQRKKAAMKAEMVQGLESQMAERQRKKAEEQQKEAEFRREVEANLALGTLSTLQQKALERERKQKFVAALDDQIRDHTVRRRQEVPTKLW